MSGDISRAADPGGPGCHPMTRMFKAKYSTGKRTRWIKPKSRKGPVHWLGKFARYRGGRGRQPGPGRFWKIPEGQAGHLRPRPGRDREAGPVRRTDRGYRQDCAGYSGRHGENGPRPRPRARPISRSKLPPQPLRSQSGRSWIRCFEMRSPGSPSDLKRNSGRPWIGTGANDNGNPRTAGADPGRPGRRYGRQTPGAWRSSARPRRCSSAWTRRTPRTRTTTRSS